MTSTCVLGILPSIISSAMMLAFLLTSLTSKMCFSSANIKGLCQYGYELQAQIVSACDDCLQCFLIFFLDFNFFSHNPVSYFYIAQFQGFQLSTAYEKLLECHGRAAAAGRSHGHNTKFRPRSEVLSRPHSSHTGKCYTQSTLGSFEGSHLKLRILIIQNLVITVIIIIIDTKPPADHIQAMLLTVSLGHTCHIRFETLGSRFTVRSGRTCFRWSSCGMNDQIYPLN